ncbi:uncharacterized protein [Musca autumnalis]|uniref:uncharacterized protein n=1 Tax=Musca autumnalis TaxID=221902 RepID=UPI003CF9BF21
MKNPLLTFFKLAVFCVLINLSKSAPLIQNPKLNDISKGEEGFLELRPNGNLILRSTLEQSPNTLQQALLFKSILNAIRAVPQKAGNTLNELSVKIYGEGVEHKFPPFLERVIQRIQTYFSVYKYTDTSEPVRDKYKPINDTLYEEIDVTLSSDSGGEVIKNKTGKPIAATIAMMSSTKTTTPTTTTAAAAVTTTFITSNENSLSTQPLPLPDQSIDDEENEFIEIKKAKQKRKS